MSGRVLRRETVHLACGAYTGAQCPWCKVVVQAVIYDASASPCDRDLGLALERHVAVVHPERLRQP